MISNSMKTEAASLSWYGFIAFLRRENERNDSLTSSVGCCAHERNGAKKDVENESSRRERLNAQFVLCKESKKWRRHRWQTRWGKKLWQAAGMQLGNRAYVRLLYNEVSGRSNNKTCAQKIPSFFALNRKRQKQWAEWDGVNIYSPENHVDCLAAALSCSKMPTCTIFIRIKVRLSSTFRAQCKHPFRLGKSHTSSSLNLSFNHQLTSAAAATLLSGMVVQLSCN